MRALGLLLLCLGVPSLRAEQDPILLWLRGAPGEKPGFPGPEAHVPHVYPPSNYKGVEVHNVSEPTLTPFLVAGSEGGVVIAPGGGYQLLAIDLEGVDVAKRLNSYGVSAFLLKYRVPMRPADEGLPWNWAQIQDAQRAMGIVRGKAVEWGLDPKKVAFMGFSAGGHLTAHISTAWTERLYPSQDGYDSVSCRPDLSFLIYPWKLLKDNDPKQHELAPELNVTGKTPPAFIAGNRDDPDAYPQNLLQYYEALALDAKVPSSLHQFPSGGHGFGICQPFLTKEACCDWPDLAQRILNESGFLPKQKGPAARPILI